MIKIPFSLPELDALAEDFYKEMQNKISISENIVSRAIDPATPVFEYLNNNIEEIVKGKPNILENHIAYISPLIIAAKAAYHAVQPVLTTRQVNAWFKKEILGIFNYDSNHLSFTKMNAGELAYRHANRLSLSTCPYCNAQFTFTIKNSRYKTRPHFDHYFNKARYPYFALSFYNLIPSCYICNSNLKGSKSFKYSTHIHPFIEGIEGLYKFKTNVDSVDFLLGKKDFSISLEKNPKANSVNITRAEKSLKDFEIQDRYNHHKDYAGEIIKKSHFYNYTAIKEFLNSYTIHGKKLFTSEGEIIEMVLGNYIHEKKLHKRILSKLTKDIAEEFGIKL